MGRQWEGRAATAQWVQRSFLHWVKRNGTQALGNLPYTLLRVCQSKPLQQTDDGIWTDSPAVRRLKTCYSFTLDLQKPGLNAYNRNFINYCKFWSLGSHVAYTPKSNIFIIDAHFIIVTSQNIEVLDTDSVILDIFLWHLDMNLFNSWHTQAISNSMLRYIFKIIRKNTLKINLMSVLTC